MNPWVLYIGVPVIIILCLLRFKKKQKYQNGKRVANTSLIEETECFKKLYREYKILCRLAMSSILVAVGIGFVMLSRPAKVESISPEIHNRDIFLCMDVSSSVDELNLDMCDKLKKVVEELDGERFGITIFNGQSVLLVPLTNDYQYVLETLDTLEKCFKNNIAQGDDWDILNNDTDWDLFYYIYEGTLADEGSSLIGDGLASALYSFPDLENNKDRSRMIIFTTDNELYGDPCVSLEQAAELCKKNEVKVFAIAPKKVTDENVFKLAVESTGGGYYKNTAPKAYDQLVEDIKKTHNSLVGVKKTETQITDRPEELFVWMLICIGVYFVICKKLKI